MPAVAASAKATLQHGRSPTWITHRETAKRIAPIISKAAIGKSHWPAIGRLIALQDRKPGSPEFHASYNAAVAAMTKRGPVPSNDIRKLEKRAKTPD
jgi:hypothetical protein